MNTDQKYYIIESGKMLELAEKLRIEYSKSIEIINSYVNSLGGKSYNTSLTDNALHSIGFNHDIPEGFCKPDRYGLSRPKKKSPYYAEFKKYKKTDLSSKLQENLKVPLVVSYKKNGSFSGSSRIGNMWKPVGIYWFKKDGPILLIIPDVAKAVKEFSDTYGDEISFENGVENWRLDETGLKEIIKEEWDLMVAKHKKSTEE
jgi:hypothetical protein